ncbi:MAG: hypothetical protein IPK44_01740 [Candidatus Accumulibacter sp.]|uniref:hypothetical protein n=1 Tax=Accumulibacter sp. TaxID=2053492 RepID=UPI0025887B43|nr:hypothetical protein [Accumulibacter sp.]MBK8113322.1 hypothetical protein [Accumulibacter sp.]
MLTQADIDAAVAESWAKTQELLSEYGEQFVRPMVEVQKRMQDARIMMQGGEDGQRITEGNNVQAEATDESPGE